ncbi:hypothetical protein BV898_01287 [Hypsibius exemplaris]|uniref:Uncharacterized protein n=1 Tax=Hypsibius exemplaris TaxID=2072580 RepID=A0A1W0XC62_HYPEX|nr:hypothetical protein BV898_01287 [Hypsibius exemplaris]
MDIPTLPFFDESEEAADNVIRLNISGSRIIIFCLSVIVARRIKDCVWPRESRPARRLWSVGLRRQLIYSFVLSFCLVADIAVAAVAGSQILAGLSDQSSKLADYLNRMWILPWLFLFAQLGAFCLRMGLKTASDLAQTLRNNPWPSLRYALFLEFISMLCVVPVLAALLYREPFEQQRDLSAQNVVGLVVVSTLAFFYPRKSETGDAAPSASQMLKMKLDNGDIIDEYPLNLVIRKSSSDNMLAMDPEMPPEIPEATPSEEDLSAEKDRPALIINAEGCSPALVSRLRQMGDLRIRSVAERRASFRSHQPRSAPNLTGAPAPQSDESV